MPRIPDRLRIGALVMLALATAAFAQPPAPLEFEVASIKPSPPSDGPRESDGRGGPGTSDTTQASWTNWPLWNILTRGYNVWSDQIVAPSEVISQLKSILYDIVVKIPPGTTKAQFQVMLQNLLAERFHLVLHHETREFDSYELVIAKTGLKLKESSPADKAFDQASTNPRPAKDVNGVWQLGNPGTVNWMQPGANGRPTTVLLIARAQSLDPLLMVLNMNLNRHWADKTGLTGIFDYRLEFAPENLMYVNPDGSPIPPKLTSSTGQTGDVPLDPTPNLASALQQQLGLKLDSKKISLDVLVIDHVDKTPTEN